MFPDFLETLGFNKSSVLLILSGLPTFSVYVLVCLSDLPGGSFNSVINYVRATHLVKYSQYVLTLLVKYAHYVLTLVLE